MPSRLDRYFRTAEHNSRDRLRSGKSSGKNCAIGLEVETLFVDRDSKQPISADQSRQIFEELASSQWSVAERKNGVLTRVEKPLGSRGMSAALYFELGRNNLEVIFPVRPARDICPNNQETVNELLSCTLEALRDVREAAARQKSIPVDGHYDGHADADTLIIPDERDRVWTILDGEVLCVLGHIASVHINIDACSIDEAMAWIAKLNALYRRMSWPAPWQIELWGRYIRESLARYEPGRFGPPPETYETYLESLAGHKVVMNTADGRPQLVEKPLRFSESKEVDTDLFLRSVWWWSRLRVRNGMLVLEVRGIPRADDASLASDVLLVLRELGVI